jgi:hypothetical protein
LANFSCSGDTSGANILPASSSGCISVTAGKSSSDNSVQPGTAARANQIQSLHDLIVEDTQRRRMSPPHTTINAGTNVEISFDDTMARIKANLTHLTGHTLAVNKGDLLRAADIQVAYEQLRRSQASCVCINRCTCNARTATRDNVRETTSEVSNQCPSNQRCDEVSIGCHCRSRCGTVTGLGCWGVCDCDSRGCTCNAQVADCLCVARTTITCNQVCTCDTRCSCDARTSVECNCNIRTVSQTSGS